MYVHEWRQHDLVMWDNRQTMHRAHRYKSDEVRDMRRTTIAGDGPTVAQADDAVAASHQAAAAAAAQSSRREDARRLPDTVRWEDDMLDLGLEGKVALITGGAAHRPSRKA